MRGDQTVPVPVPVGAFQSTGFVRLATCLVAGLALVITGCDDSITAPPEPIEEAKSAPDFGPLSFRMDAAASATAVAIPPFTVTPIGFDFGEVQVGATSGSMDTNITNVSSLPMNVSLAGGAPGGSFSGSTNCAGVTLDPGESCQISYRFSPTAAGAATSSSNFTVNGTAYGVNLSGTGVDPKFQVTPTGHGFGAVAIGTTSASMATTITNIGSAPAAVGLAGGAPGGGQFTGSTNCGGVTLDPGDSCQISYRFNPTVAGPATSSSNFTVNGQPFSVTLSGTGVPPSFRVTPIGHDFGEHEVGTTTPSLTTVITNTGSGPVAVAIAGGAPAGPFDGSTSCVGVTLDPGESCQISYTFSPTATGLATSSSNFTLNGVPYTVALAGTGIAAGTSPTSQFHVAQTAIDFGQIQVGETSGGIVANITNIGSAPAPVNLAGGAPPAPFSGSTNCGGATLDPGESCQISYTFSPTTAGPASSSSNFTVDGMAFGVALSGTGVDPSFRVTPIGHAFGEWQVGTTSPAMQTIITNTGTAAAMVSLAGGAPPGGEFGGSTNCASAMLDPGDSCQISYTFHPTVAGPASSSSNFTVNGQPYAVVLEGIGVDPKFLVTPTGHDFGAQLIGTTSGALQTHITNVGLAAAPVSLAGGAPPGGEFGGSTSCGGATLDPGDSCQISYTFQPTAGGPASSSSSFTVRGQPFVVALRGFGLGDHDGPMTEAVTVTPNPVQVNGAITVTAVVTDALSNVASAEYSIDGGPWLGMSASDGAFDELMEDVTADGTAPAAAGIVDVCVRGTDAAGNTGAPVCALLVVFDPDGGFVTGAGWFDSPAGAFIDDPTLIGKASFAFVSKYQRGRTTPDGNTSFRFRAAGLDFDSDRYDFLIVNQGGTNAQFKGAGLINGIAAPNGSAFQFMIWAGDGNPDTFRIRIWFEDGGTEYPVYDNGSHQPIAHGSIVVHR